MKARWIRRVMSLMLVCMMVIAVAAPALAVSGSETLAKRGDNYYVIASTLNVRTGPSTGYRVKTQIHKGRKVQFRYMENGWWYVRYSTSGGGKYGWVDKQYLTRSNVPYTGTYKTTARLRVRTFPSTAYGIRGTLSKGARIRVLQLNGDWCRINYNGYSGWVASKYLKKV